MFDPFQYAQTTPWLSIQHTTQLPEGVLGATIGHTIWLRAGLTPAEERCTLTHELLHYHHGHSGHQSAHIEQTINDEAARLLISLEALIDAGLAYGDLPTMAHALDVDDATLQARLDGLTASERAIILEAWENY